ncbi:MAG: hypothetical protein HRU43_07330 [Simkaniaceae bacterium]|nr:hypothetical protein [Simkaniaceae bacterium]
MKGAFFVAKGYDRKREIMRIIQVASAQCPFEFQGAFESYSLLRLDKTTCGLPNEKTADMLYREMNGGIMG